jgi:phosphatidate cytidylyltransferase
MLKQRVITAVILLAILLPALFWRTPEPFLAITLLLIAAGGWEWGRLNGLGGAASIVLGAITLALCIAAWSMGLPNRPSVMLWTITGAAWVLAGAWLVKVGVPGWPRIPQAVRIVVGVLALVLAWLAMAQARVIGVNFLLSVLVLVWVADIFAYFAGRAFGLKFTKRKLAPAISPGKSWEGVWGGMAGVLVLAPWSGP